MHLRYHPWLVLLVLLAGLVVASVPQGLPSEAAAAMPPAQATVSRGAATPSKRGDLFADASPAVGASPSVADPQVLRSRAVNVNFGTLASGSLQLNLFPDVTLTAVRERSEPTSSGRGSIWLGRVNGVNESRVTLVAEDGVLSGNINLAGATYQVRYAGGAHVVREVDQRLYPPDKPAVPVRAPATPSTRPSGPAVTTSADDGSTIDVMVVYTAAARQAAGGTTAMNTLVDLGITETNTAYQNSLVTQRVRLVYKGEVVYTETGNLDTDLTRLATPEDGFLDNVQALRNQYGADIVSLWVENGGGTFCGIGYQMETVASWFEQYAYNVVVRDCATGNYSFGHEMGHNMGLRHDWVQDSTDNSPFTYNHGHIGTGNAFATIMAYQSSCGTFCPRIQYFSNPNVTYNGLAVGVPETQFHPAYNAKALNNTANTVANFRASVPVLPPTLTPTVTPTATPTPASRTCILGDINCDGIVDIRDYGIWRQNFGQTNCGNPADLNGDCIVDIRDYGVWRANFGHTAGTAPRGETAPAPQGTPGPAPLVGDRASAGNSSPLPGDGSSPTVPVIPLVGGLLGLEGLAGWRRRRPPGRQ